MFLMFLFSQTKHIWSRVAFQSFSNLSLGPLRLSVYGGGLLTLVAFKYGVMDHLPSVPYPTFTDNFLPLGPSWTARWKSHGRGTPVLLDLLR